MGTVTLPNSQALDAELGKKDVMWDWCEEQVKDV
jgi:hypothetical protein